MDEHVTRYRASGAWRMAIVQDMWTQSNEQGRRYVGSVHWRNRDTRGPWGSQYI